jgi:ABC-type protease/lipase transport system fused ATPase/permease subunit
MLLSNKFSGNITGSFFHSSPPLQAAVSVKRVNKLLKGYELDKNCVTSTPGSSTAICVERGTFSWSRDEQPILKDISFSIGVGKLVGVVGAVATGKSSLLSALLGDMEVINGSIAVNGSVAYVPQQVLTIL